MPYTFILMSALVLYTIVYFVPKRLSYSEMYTTSIFAILFNTLVDVYLDLRLDLYGYFKKGPDYETLLVLVGIFPPFNIIYLNRFPYGEKLVIKIRYILIWAMIAVFYEYLAFKSGLLYYRKWSLLYSAMCYPFSLTITVLNYMLIKRLSK
ncbi:hypothetical protein PU629_21205 [Pullulanibacillus sp. KACC 23026]|uniref:CBO0543 family protein n=1 Tax=Pullulanibacillus sp. KACC 23026 TaxID=3028315 RepID=UPI0023AE966C|nr:CBO0543 family protein [Pullulanibacillus sp. KACC 23026]WEG12575.1 hypothetical protein PU629_21205 [Pullulanibacillus sp. KACC 23026]